MSEAAGLSDAGTQEDGPLAAGEFSAWLTGMQAALRGEAASDVPCNGCTACCTSSQFVHFGPDEEDALGHIPAGLLFPAPLRPVGHFVLGYDENGHCPMLIDGRCSIYEHRPRTCRTYDCRVFPAACVEVDDEAQSAIARRARRWEFAYPDDVDRVRHDAVRAAATFVRERREGLLADAAQANATQRAVLAVHLHEAFLGHEDAGAAMITDPEPEVIKELLERRSLDLPAGAPAAPR